jgi:DNA invertase Pin-like site-specific DNA recombinase
MAGKTLGYIRISSASQNTARQEKTLGDEHVDKVFVDTFSGKTLDRPALTQLLEYIRDGDLVVVASMDRIARNVEGLRKVVRQITDAGARIKFLKEGLTFSGEDNSSAKLLLNVMGAVAEFERELIRERQFEGIQIAKTKGVYKGRTKVLKPSQVEDIKVQVTNGVPKAKIARDLGISRKSLYNYLGKS